MDIFENLKSNLHDYRYKTIDSSACIRAAILVPIWYSKGVYYLILTRRSKELRHHAGEISFPGGVCEPGEYPVRTAMREFSEELGISTEKIRIVGRLDDQLTATGFHITPVIGLLRHRIALRPNRDEVAEVLRIPINHFQRKDIVGTRMMDVNGKILTFPFYTFNSAVIWGATARIIEQLNRLLFSIRP